MDIKQYKAISSAFKAVNQTADQNVTVDTPVFPVMYPDKLFDLNNEYSPITSTFTPKQNGLYSINASVAFFPNDTNANYRVVINIRVNEIPIVTDNAFFGPDPVATGDEASISAILQLAAWDKVQISVFVHGVDGVIIPEPRGTRFEAVRIPFIKVDYSKSNLAYVANLFGNSVTVLDIDNNTIINTIPVDTAPFDIAVTPDGRYAYVTLRPNKLAVIDTKTNAIFKIITVGLDPTNVSITKDGKFAYVSNYVGNTVSVIDIKSNTVIDTIESTSFANPGGIAITPYGRLVYIVNSGFVTPNGDTVSVIDTKTNTVIKTIPVGNVPVDATVTPDGKYVYVTNWFSRSVSVIKKRINKVIDTIAVGDGPNGIAFTPDGKYAYVANQFENTVSVIETATNIVVKTIPVIEGPAGIAITPDGKLVYITNFFENTLSVIDVETNTVIDTIIVGGQPINIALRPALREENCE